MEEILAENNHKILEAQRKLDEERLAMVEQKRKMDEERRALEKAQKKAEKLQQDIILNRKGSRDRVSFGIKPKQVT